MGVVVGLNGFGIGCGDLGVFGGVWGCLGMLAN